MADLKNPGERVFPGDALASSEEFLPGDGTFEDGSWLRAARIGTYEVDTKDMRVLVKPATSVPSTLRVGDFVYAKINLLKPSMCGAEVLHVEGAERTIVGDTNGTLHVSKIARRYIQEPAREYRLGDIIRARVIDAKPSVQLSTEDPRCGAILARCLRDRFPLVKIAKALECPECGRRDTRNIAPDYGQVHIPASVALQVPQT